MARFKPRLDELLVERGLFSDRDQAARACMAGVVRSGDSVLTKPGMRISSEADVQITDAPRFVSRGGEKLAGALRDFSFDPSGLRCVDIGASTGGFTDCLLQSGAESVCAIDVGYGQLAWTLRTDERVKVCERTNVRHIDPEVVGAPFDLVVADLSFIPLAIVLPIIQGLLIEDGFLIALVKPQFEVSKKLVGDKGVVREESGHVEALQRVLDALDDTHMAPCALTVSPLKGPEGNIEFFLMAQRGGIPATISIPEVIGKAHSRFGAP